MRVRKLQLAHGQLKVLPVTYETLEDLPALESRYMRRAPELLDLSFWQDIQSGDGVAKTSGFRGSDSMITVTRSANNVIDYDDITGVINRSFVAIKQGAQRLFWLTSWDCREQLMQLTDTSGRLIWKDNMNEGITGSLIQPSLAGYPVVFSEDAPALGGLGDLSFIDPDGMHLSQKAGGTRFAESMHFYFDTDKMAFRWIRRQGGQSRFSSAYTPRNGGSTVSPFVQLSANT